MSETQPAAPQLQGNMFMFRKPELLTKEAHAGLGISRPERPFSFCASVRAIPLTITEIAAAQKHYPIIYAEEKKPLPMAVVGIIDDVNLFVDDAGNWEENVYIPGYVRRYPFALAGDQNSDRMAIIVDREYEGVSTSPETPFFDGDNPSEPTKQAMDYCATYERDRNMTLQFSEQLAKYDLITNQVAQFTPEGGEAQPFAQYNGVEEKRLTELDDEKFMELRKSNILPVLYAQLMSMGNWRFLMDRRARRFGLTQENLMQPVPKQ